MLDPEKRYYLTTLKRSRNDYINIPDDNREEITLLDKDYEKCEKFFELIIDRTVENSISFILMKTWDIEIGEIYENACSMTYVKNDGYYFTFLEEEISIEELQDELIIADYFENINLFDKNQEENILKQAEWFLALCGTVPYIYNYVGRK